MATKEIANNVGNNISEFSRNQGRRASRGGQHFLDRMLRATGGGVSSAGESTESALNSMADSLPINKERIRTRNMRLALGAISLAAIATGIRYREQIMSRFRSGTPEEQPVPLAEAAPEAAEAAEGSAQEAWIGLEYEVA